MRDAIQFAGAAIRDLPGVDKESTVWYGKKCY